MVLGGDWHSGLLLRPADGAVWMRLCIPLLGLRQMTQHRWVSVHPIKWGAVVAEAVECHVVSFDCLCGLPALAAHTCKSIRTVSFM